MQIDLPPDERQMLTDQAIASGYQRVEDYVSTLLAQVAREKPSTVEFEADVPKCEENYASYKANGGRDAKEALQEIARELGLKVPE